MSEAVMAAICGPVRYPHRVAAQISMYPMDFPHVEHLLAHQIRVWGPMVDRIVVTVDTHRSKAGRYRGTHFDDYLARLRTLVAEIAEHVPALDMHEVDYSERARREVAQAFFGCDDIPVKAWDGGPFYAYFQGMHHANARYIVHFDSDMFFGGGSTRWVEDAIRVMEADPSLLLTSPLPGPPRADGMLLGHGADVPSPIEIDGMHGYRFRHASTRIFMLDMDRLYAAVGRLPLLAPGLPSRIKARLLGNPPRAREAEVIIGETLRAHGLWRLDFLGSAPGLWSLHPPYRNAAFYERLPSLIEAVEQGRVPEAQRGDYDMNDSMIDWSAQRAANRRHHRYMRLLRDRLGLAR
jgi:hypothetical protein